MFQTFICPAALSSKNQKHAGDMASAKNIPERAYNFFGLLGVQRFDAWRTDSRLMFEIIRTNKPWHICSIPWIMFYYAYSPVVLQNPYIVVSKEKASISLCLHLKMRLSNGPYLSRPVSPRSIKNSLEMTATVQTNMFCFT